MTSKDEALQVLIDLGLTSSQARIYFDLSQTGVCSVKKISKISHISRQHIYGILQPLQDLGLVEKKIFSPSKFRGIPLEDGISILLQRRTKKTAEIQKQKMKIIKRWKNNNLQMLSEDNYNENNYDFILIPPKKASIKKRRNKIEAARTSIDVLISTKRLLPTCETYHNVIRNALQRGVKIRAITEEPKNENTIKFIDDFKKYISFEISYVLNPPSSILTIYDKKEILITTFASAFLGESPVFWSNNPSLVTLIQISFDKIWNTSLEEQH